MALVLSTFLTPIRPLRRSTYRGVQMATIFQRSWLSVLLFMFIGCDSQEKVSLTASVSLQFERMSPSGTHFRLVNGSNEVISFRGKLVKEVGASPWDTLMECKSPGSEIWQESPFALVDGGSETVAVPTGE